MKYLRSFLILPILLFVFASAEEGCQSETAPTDNQPASTSVNPVSTVKINLPSIQCGMCQNTIEKGLMKTAGITSVKVDLDTKTAEIAYESSKLQVQQIEKVVTDLGYWANDKPANEKAYSNLHGCCQMPDADYQRLLKSAVTEPIKGPLQWTNDPSGC